MRSSGSFGSLGSELVGCGSIAAAVSFAAGLVIAGRTLPDWVNWSGAALLALLGGWAVLANWVIPFRKGGGSLVPLFGGAFVAAALTIVPVDSLNSFWWVPLFLDLGCVPLLTITAAFLLYRAVLPRRDDSPRV